MGKKGVFGKDAIAEITGVEDGWRGGDEDEVVLSVLTFMDGMGCPRCDRRDGLVGDLCTVYCK